jgi:hypothetical protein
MLLALTPEEFAGMLAARETLPLDDGWRQTDTICGAIQNEFAQHFAMKAGKSRVPKDWLHKLGSYIPRLLRKKPKKVEVNQASIDVTQAIIESHFLG